MDRLLIMMIFNQNINGGGVGFFFFGSLPMWRKPIMFEALLVHLYLHQVDFHLIKIVQPSVRDYT